jgi:hypothetical protein
MQRIPPITRDLLCTVLLYYNLLKLLLHTYTQPLRVSLTTTYHLSVLPYISHYISPPVPSFQDSSSKLTQFVSSPLSLSLSIRYRYLYPHPLRQARILRSSTLTLSILPPLHPSSHNPPLSILSTTLTYIPPHRGSPYYSIILYYILIYSYTHIII